MSSHILCLRAVEDEGDSQFELPFPKHPEVEEDRPDSDLSGLVGHQVHQMITGKLCQEKGGTGNSKKLI